MASSQRITEEAVISRLEHVIECHTDAEQTRKKLDDAVDQQRRYCDSELQDEGNLVMLCELAHKLDDRFNATGRLADIDEAVKLMTKVVKSTPSSHAERAPRLNNLGLYLNYKYAIAGQDADLEAAIDCYRLALLCDHPDRAEWQNNLCTALLDKHNRTGDVTLLEDAVTIGRQSLVATPTDHHDLARRMKDLGDCLQARYSRLSKLSDLDEAIDLKRQATGKFTTLSNDYAEHYCALSVSLRDRYLHLSEMADLDESLECARLSTRLCSPTDPDLPEYENHHGIAALEKYKRTKDRIYEQEGTAAFYKAVEKTPEGHPGRNARLLNLSVTLRDRAKESRALSDIDAGIAFAEQAVAARSTLERKLPGYQINLADLYILRYQVTSKNSDLEKAIQLAREAVASSSRTHIEYASWQIMLAKYLLVRYDTFKNSDDLVEAETLYQAASLSVTSHQSSRMYAFRWLIKSYVSKKDWKNVVEAGKGALGLLPGLVPRPLSNADKQFLISSIVGIASVAAAAALRQNDVETAILLSEKGRGVLVGDLMDMRPDLATLQHQHPGLAKQYDVLREQIVQPLELGAGRRTANVLFDQLLEEIRAKEGFDDFMLPLSVQQICDTAGNGCLVIINVTIHRSDAILIRRTGASFVHLPDLGWRQAEDKAKRFTERGADLDLLEWLWDAVAQPIMGQLELHTRVWWIPTGPLTRLPIHAAGRHTDGQSVLDHVVSSYSSSIKALFRSHNQPQSHQDKFAIVAAPDVAGHAYLEHAVREATVVERLCPSLGLHPSRPEPDTVMKALHDCRMFHFAGHVTTNPEDPLQSKLLLSGASVTVNDILNAVPGDGVPFMAYLSACGTGELDNENLTDEGIHLISACQLAGFPHVIGTLRQVEDDVASQIAEKTYKVIAAHSMSHESVSLGLHEAVKALRADWLIKQDADGDSDDKLESMVGPSTIRASRNASSMDSGPVHWASYCHFGV